jgi:hypothetical protein
LALSKLKPPGTKRLKLEYDGPLSNFCFQMQLAPLHTGLGFTFYDSFSSMYRRHNGTAVQVDPIKPVLKAP